MLVWAVTRTYPNYDSYYHLVWGRELLDGLAPTFEAYAAPTQHPLYVALGALLGFVFGESADRVLVLVCLLSHAALVFGAYRLGAAVFGRWSGALGALFVAASASFLLYAARGYVDAPFLALVVWAGVLEAEGRAPWALLVAAGLLRPEAWVLAGLAWCWRLPRLRHSTRRLVTITAAVVAAPVVWALVDWAVTGDPLHSLHATIRPRRRPRAQARTRARARLVRELRRRDGAPARRAARAGRRRARAAAGRVAGAARPARAVRGGRDHVRRHGGARALDPAALPHGAGVALCLFAGYALLGFTALAREHAWRRRWQQGSAAATVVGAVGLVILAPSLTNVREEVRFIRATHDSLVALLDDPAVRAGMRCGTLTFPTYRLVPGRPLARRDARIGARSAARRERGVEVFALGQKALRRYGLAAGTSPQVNIPSPGYEPIARHGLLSAYRRC